MVISNNEREEEYKKEFKYLRYKLENRRKQDVEINELIMSTRKEEEMTINKNESIQNNLQSRMQIKYLERVTKGVEIRSKGIRRALEVDEIN